MVIVVQLGLWQLWFDCFGGDRALEVPVRQTRRWVWIGGDGFPQWCSSVEIYFFFWVWCLISKSRSQRF